ncbi:uncharacterized protein PADG_01231 [Paracoccidioides brasiliensis Pb18]|uniref:Uncharacterized protein n=1 Tax=Paracoccidioides brasiliensis (strain Pb18) TaxID=502780 RepID=C1G2R5_PARBD|nr:uncharacterized protein PADG_01231 [Paracoccidioides brasiliensis Pb18]EEH45081.2 hypothetical protein PADG_01231 [Paracoccidioides brasiliensis Pb18]
MSLAPYPTPSPHVYPSPHDVNIDAASQYSRRKTSLTKSLQTFAKNTFHRRHRHTNTGDSSHSTTPATSFTSSWCSTSPGASQSRSEEVMERVTPVLRKLSLTLGGTSQDQIQKPKEIAGSIQAGQKPRLGRRDGFMDLQKPPAPVNSCISYEENGSERGQTNGGQQRSVQYANTKDGRAPSQVSRIPLPSPQPDGYSRRRHTNAGLVFPKSTTFSSLSSLKQGYSLSRSQSLLSKNNKGSCRQPELLHQQQMGAMAQKLETAHTAIANKPSPESFGPRQYLTPQQHSHVVPKGSSLTKSRTTINLTSYARPHDFFEPAESFINHYQRISHSKHNIVNDCGHNGSPRGLRNHYNPQNAGVKDVHCSNAQKPGSLKEQSPMELPSPCSPPESDSDIRKVTTAKPHQYWLGRFSTLTNGFHYEDSFRQESDAVTGFDASEPYYISSSSTATLDDQRAKRAFVFLENACTTAEARGSFLEFRYEYSKRCGDRWSKWFAADQNVTCKKRYGGSTSDLSDETLISVGEVTDMERKSNNNGAPRGRGTEIGGIGLINMFRTVRRSLV